MTRAQRLAIFLLALALLFAMTMRICCQRRTIERTETASIFGVTIRSEWGDPQAMQAAVEAGITWVRGSLRWADIEPVPGLYQFEFPDLYLTTLSAYGFKPVIFVANNPPWAAATPCGPITDTMAMASFMGALAERYPEVAYWELYNEADYRYVAGNPGGCFGDYPAEYAALLTDVRAAMHAANPDAKLVFGVAQASEPFNPDFAAQVMEAGGQFDVMDFHYYPTQPGPWETWGPGIAGKARYMRSLLAAHGRDVPMMVSETGKRGDDVAPAQSEYLVKTYTQAMSEGLIAVMWFTLVNIGEE